MTVHPPDKSTTWTATRENEVLLCGMSRLPRRMGARGGGGRRCRLAKPIPSAWTCDVAIQFARRNHLSEAAKPLMPEPLALPLAWQRAQVRRDADTRRASAPAYCQERSHCCQSRDDCGKSDLRQEPSNFCQEQPAATGGEDCSQGSRARLRPGGAEDGATERVGKIAGRR